MAASVTVVQPAGKPQDEEAGPADTAVKVRLQEEQSQLPADGGYVSVSYKDIAREFVLMGWTAFGGPAAHIGLFQKRFVEKLRWMSHEVFIELYALGSCLPGPSSTQVSFAIGTIKQGVSGGMLSGVLFQYPGAIIMTAVGAAAARILESPAPWLLGISTGVSAVGVALVASAARSLCHKVCPDPVPAVLCSVAAVASIYKPAPWMFPTLIGLGGLATVISRRKQQFKIEDEKEDTSVQSRGCSMWGGAALIAAWLAVLIIVIVLVNTVYKDSPPGPLQWFEVFYRIGSVIYGGGQVVLPMLKNDLVFYDCQGDICAQRADSWVNQEQFFAGLGIVQAMPGPLFNFAAYLGAIIAMNQGYLFLWGAVIAWLGLFGPGLMLIFGVLPFWYRFRQWVWYKRALPGFNSAAVGLVVASVFQMTLDVYRISPFPNASLGIGILAFAAVDYFKLFEPAVVLAGAVLGVIAWAAKMT